MAGFLSFKKHQQLPKVSGYRRVSWEQVQSADATDSNTCVMRATSAAKPLVAVFLNHLPSPQPSYPRVSAPARTSEVGIRSWTLLAFRDDAKHQIHQIMYVPLVCEALDAFPLDLHVP
eukprot:909102-Amphidinium_carterae.2